MKCEFCGLDIPVEKCMFAHKKIIEGKEYVFCCDRCSEDFESHREEEES